MVFHKNLVGADLHIGKSNTGTGSPTGSVTAGVIGELYYDTAGDALYVAEAADDSHWVSVGGGGTGDVSGPASSTDTAIVRFDGAGGKTLQDSGVIIDGSNNLSLPAGAKLNFEGAAGDSYLIYNSTNSKVELFVSGTKQVEWG